MMTDGLAAIKSGKCWPRFTVKGVAAATPLTIPLPALIGEELLGRQTGRCHVSPIGRSEGLAQVKDISEKILYWLSLGVQLRALAERLLDRFADTVGDLPASAGSYCSESDGPYGHSFEAPVVAGHSLKPKSTRYSLVENHNQHSPKS